MTIKIEKIDDKVKKTITHEFVIDSPLIEIENLNEQIARAEAELNELLEQKTALENLIN